MTQQEMLQALQDLLGADKVRTDTDALITFGRDWTKIHEPKPSAIVFPRSTEEVQALVKFANQHQLALVPSGGRTGLSAGAVATQGEIVVAFDYMNQLLEFNPVDRSVTVEAGMITEQLQQIAEEKGLFYPVDFASAGSSQIGGNISTNAGGIKVIRYGMTRDWVTGLRVVTGQGDILELNNRGLLKNNTGYDLRHLFIGAEGTLGLITEATIQLARAPKDLQVLVLGVVGMAEVMQVLHTFQTSLDLTAFEFFSHNALEKVVAHQGLNAPFATQAPYYALIEFEATQEETLEEAMRLFEACVEQAWVVDGAISQSEQQAQNLWRLREDISETISQYTPYKNDISVRVSKVPQFLEEVDQVVSEHYPDFEIVWFGHIGDGNLHLNILKPESLAKEEFFSRCHQVSQWVFAIVSRYQGSVSAEHGVGLIKKDYLHHTRTPEEIAYMKAIKRAFDPQNVLNPGKIFDL